MRLKRNIVKVLIILLVIVSFVLVWIGVITIPIGIISIVSGGIVVKIFSYILDKIVGKDITYEKFKLYHSQYLVTEGFGVAASNGYVYYENDKITSIPVSWVKSDDVNQHLKDKKYRELCYAYEYAKDYADRWIPNIKNELRNYREHVTQKLIEAQIPLPVFERFIDYNTEHYDISFVRQLIFDDLYRLLKRNESGNKLKIDSSALYWGGKAFAVGDAASLECLKNVIQNIEKDKTIKYLVCCIQGERLLLEKNLWLDIFNDMRREIINSVIKKRKPLDGMCNMCPD